MSEYFRKQALKVWIRELTVGSVGGDQWGRHDVKLCEKWPWLNVQLQGKRSATFMINHLHSSGHNWIERADEFWPINRATAEVLQMSPFTLLILAYFLFLISTTFYPYWLISKLHFALLLHVGCLLWASSVVWILARYAIATM